MALNVKLTMLLLLLLLLFEGRLGKFGVLCPEAIILWLA